MLTAWMMPSAALMVVPMCAKEQVQDQEYQDPRLMLEDRILGQTIIKITTITIEGQAIKKMFQTTV